MALNSSTSVYGYKPPKNIREGQISKSKKIYGFLFPLGKTYKNGLLPKTSGIELVKNNLIQLLRTERGERVMLPDFGCNLRKFLFEPLDEESFRAIKSEILTTINKYAVGVEIIKLSVSQLDDYGTEGLQAIQVKLVVKLSELEEVTFEVSTRIG
jgi:phage baseplate assembly protein W